MNTERGEPTWVNWSKTEWAIVEAKQDAATEKGYKEATKPDRLKKALPFKAGGKVSSASSRADGCAQRGKTKGRMV